MPHSKILVNVVSSAYVDNTGLRATVFTFPTRDAAYVYNLVNVILGGISTLLLPGGYGSIGILL